MNPPPSTRAPQGAPFLALVALQWATVHYRSGPGYGLRPWELSGPVHISLLSRVRTDRITPKNDTLILRTVDLIPGCSAGLCSRAQLPRTPVVADSGRAAYAAALPLQRMDLHLTEFQ
jgi:hypothetical protein